MLYIGLGGIALQALASYDNVYELSGSNAALRGCHGTVVFPTRDKIRAPSSVPRAGYLCAWADDRAERTGRVNRHHEQAPSDTAAITGVTSHTKLYQKPGQVEGHLIL
jgi:hypothetical protein